MGENGGSNFMRRRGFGKGGLAREKRGHQGNACGLVGVGHHPRHNQQGGTKATGMGENGGSNCMGGERVLRRWPLGRENKRKKKRRQEKAEWRKAERKKKGSGRSPLRHAPEQDEMWH
jgi:hypothetical protein